MLMDFWRKLQTVTPYVAMVFCAWVVLVTAEHSEQQDCSFDRFQTPERILEINETNYSALVKNISNRSSSFNSSSSVSVRGR